MHILHKTVVNAHKNGQGRLTVCNVHTVQDKRSETPAKPRSRFKKERITLG